MYHYISKIYHIHVCAFQWPLSLYLHDNPEDDSKYQEGQEWPLEAKPVDNQTHHLGELISGQGSYIPFSVTVPAPSFFIHRVRKDPYEKSKYKFEKRPKLPPINETPSNPGTLTASEIGELGQYAQLYRFVILTTLHIA